MISGAMSQSRFLPHCLAPVPAALLNLEQFLTLKSGTGKDTCTATGFSANNAKQVGVTSMWNQIKAQWNSPSWRSLPSQGEVSPRRASALLSPKTTSWTVKMDTITLHAKATDILIWFPSQVYCSQQGTSSFPKSKEPWHLCVWLLQPLHHLEKNSESEVPPWNLHFDKISK